MQTCNGIRVHNVQQKLHLNALVANKQAMFIHFQQVLRALNCLSATGATAAQKSNSFSEKNDFNGFYPINIYQQHQKKNR